VVVALEDTVVGPTMPLRLQIGMHLFVVSHRQCRGQAQEAWVGVNGTGSSLLSRISLVAADHVKLFPNLYL
jgi:hypothetical protein